MIRNMIYAIGYLGLGAALAVGVMLSPLVNAQGKPLPRVVKVLTQSVDELGREVRVERVDFAPGAESPPHRHPGHVFVYVLEGEVVSALEKGAEVTYKAGSGFYEPAGGLHAVAKNVSAADASILVFHIAEKDKPSTVLDTHAH